MYNFVIIAVFSISDIVVIFGMFVMFVLLVRFVMFVLFVVFVMIVMFVVFYNTLYFFLVRLGGKNIRAHKKFPYFDLSPST